MIRIMRFFVICALLFAILCFPLLVFADDDNDNSNNDDESSYSDQMDPDLSESPIEYRTLSSDEEEIEEEVYTLTGLTLDEIITIIIEKLREWEVTLKIDLSIEEEEDQAQTILLKLLEKKDFSEPTIDLYVKYEITGELLEKIYDKINELEKKLKLKIPEKIKIKIANKVLENLIKKQELNENLIEKNVKDGFFRELIIVIIGEIDAFEKKKKLTITQETKKDIAKVILDGLLNKNNISDEAIENAVRKAIESIYLKEDEEDDDKETKEDVKVKIDDNKIKNPVKRLKPITEIAGKTPSNDFEHIVVKGDTLANLSYKYYSASDRKRGAHWIHIYEYSVLKGYIDPKKQPIEPYDVNEAYVKLNIGQRVAIPIFKKTYPSAVKLLNKYGFKFGKDGKEIEKLIIPINIDVVKEDEED